MILTPLQCFYVNLPIGGLAAAVVFFFFKTPDNARPTKATLKEKLLQMDFIGAALMMGLIISFILALQYGGQTHPWKSSAVIGLLVGCFAISVVFVAWEIYQKERAMIVPRLVSPIPRPNTILLRKKLTARITIDDEAIRYRRLHLHVLFRRRLLRHTLFSSHLFPECL
jgi:predicted permease